MKHPPNPQKGYSLIELLVVLVIVGILAIAGISMMGNRTGGAVRGIMDELEGGLMDAHKFAVATGRDVTIMTKGVWTPGGNPMVMVRGDASINRNLATSAQWDNIVNDLRDGRPNFPAPTDVSAFTANQLSSLVLSFRLNATTTSMAREHMNAGVVTQGSPWWSNAMLATSDGKQNENIATVEPFKSDAGFKAALTAANLPGLTGTNLLFQVSPDPLIPLNHVEISGANKRFNSTFLVPVVGLSSGNAVPGGAMGMIVVQSNGATVYKFYNPGVRDGDGKWRRI